MRLPSHFPAAVLSVMLLLCALALALTANSPAVAGAHTARSAPLVQWGPDIKINPSPLTTETPAARNFSLAIDPTNPNHVVAGYDRRVPDISNSGYSWSTDGGQSWAGDIQTGSWISGTNSAPSGNTSVAFDGRGTAYYTTQVTGDTAAGYFVVTSTVGAAWSTPVPIVTSDYNSYRDQAHLAVDQHTSGPFAGSLYVAWRYFTSNFEGLWMRYSRDSGRTWSSDVHITDANHSYVAGPALAVASDGTVYAAFENEPRTTPSYYVDRSTDGGVTWGTDQLVGDGSVSRIGFLDWKGHWLALFGGPNEAIFLINNNPSLAVAPDNPRTLYLVWNDGRWDSEITTSWLQTGHHGDIAFTRSTDGGVTWSPLARINDDILKNGVDQFHPTVAAGPNGLVSIIWYDRRDDPNGYLYHVYHAQSTDGGVTWGANERVSDVANDPMANYNPKGEGYIGEYSALVYGPNFLLPSWTDTRDGGQNIYTDRGTFIPPATPTATPTSTPTATPSPLPCTLAFTDVPANAYFAPAVLWLACRTVVAGYQCGGPGEPCDPQNHPYFRPYSTSTRGQLSKMVVLGQNWTFATPPSNTFADVPSSHPFYAFVETAYAHHVISGYTCGGPGEPCDAQNRPYFRTGNSATRGQLSKILYTALTQP